jgi:cytoskeletal protein CcmA (bactofilin family)
MSFFRRETEEPPHRPAVRPAAAPPAAAARERPVTRIGEGTRIDGEITGAAEVVVDGEVQGRVRLDSRLVVGPAGTVRGLVSARAVLVAGTLEGDVHGSERVEVAASGKLLGDICAPRVTIAEGAFFKGKIEMMSERPATERGERRPPDPGGEGA